MAYSLTKTEKFTSLKLVWKVALFLIVGVIFSALSLMIIFVYGNFLAFDEEKVSNLLIHGLVVVAAVSSYFIIRRKYLVAFLLFKGAEVFVMIVAAALAKPS